ncbi:DUF7002 family protein [Hydrogenophaga sp. SL48]|uniref:DUF7002 family protein n=1 Tax=Hydrogenophaga sp. SL48 TaxID=2806347 RepID=UPI001F1D8071|nr:hypothetical protein [Hydrogenophaga sp. SL48]UJW78840.1 hypothetical protein IM738_12995 [Hydrogenophaga sp. SL48]
MPFDSTRLLRVRPYLYHLTAANNLPSIAKEMELRCARALLEGAGLSYRASTKRQEHLPIRANGGTTLIRDQKPLIKGAIEFEEGWNMARFVEHINEHVFFWPGQSSGPIDHGLNHFKRYRDEGPVILRLPTASLIAMNLKFSRYNSGAPRCSGGKYSPRGGSTYLPASEFPGTPSEIVEVVSVQACPLPSSVEVSYSPEGPWRPLRSAA